jgi:hypothetical protein
VARAIIERVTDGGGEAVIRLDPANWVTFAFISTSSDGVRAWKCTRSAEAVALLRNSTRTTSGSAERQGWTSRTCTSGSAGGKRAAADWMAPWAQRGRQPRNGEFASILGIGDPGGVERHNRLRSAYNPMAHCCTGFRRGARTRSMSTRSQPEEHDLHAGAEGGTWTAPSTS